MTKLFWGLALIFTLLPSLLWGGKIYGPFSHLGHRFKATEIISGRGVIWGMEFLLTRRGRQIIFTERRGKLFLLLLKTGKLTEIQGGKWNAKVANVEQGGLLDVKPHPRFAQNRMIFLTYAKQVARRQYTTVLAQAQLSKDNRLKNFQELFVALPPNSNTRHFGSRMAIRDGFLFFSVGDRGERKSAQQLNNDRGKIHRLTLAGNVPKDNPFFATPGARKSIYSYGHRNPQGLVFHPQTRELWSHEHGPRGGDEVNLIKAGANYGWPTISYGKEYWGPIQVGEGELSEGDGATFQTLYSLYRPLRNGLLSREALSPVARGPTPWIAVLYPS